MKQIFTTNSKLSDNNRLIPTPQALPTKQYQESGQTLKLLCFQPSWSISCTQRV